MSSSSSLPYKLRPNKAVDREIFLSMLHRLSGVLKIDSYPYVGLGGPFLEDFRLLHARIGIKEMVCVETDENTHKRQLFNRPFNTIKCVHSSIEDYVNETEFESPTIIWLDFTDPNQVQSQIELFSNLLVEIPALSILRITLNANPSSLGKPDPDELKIQRANGVVSSEAELRWRLERFKERFSTYCPADLSFENMSHRNYGKAILDALRLSSEKIVLDSPEKKLVWSFSTHYSDGQPMVTATAMMTDAGNMAIEQILDGWEFSSSPSSPLVVDLPALSTLERLTLEQGHLSKEELGFKLPKSQLKEDAFESFKKYYRVFPQFARIDQ
ncbi:O-methyltransferase [Verrucomicrobiota bacterium]